MDSKEVIQNKKNASEEIKYLMGFKDLFLVDHKGIEYVKRFKKTLTSLKDAGVKQSDIYKKLKDDGKIVSMSFEQFSKLLSDKPVKEEEKKTKAVPVAPAAASPAPVAQVKAVAPLAIDLSSAQSVAFRKYLANASDEGMANLWISNMDKLDEAQKAKLKQAISFIPADKRIGDLFKKLAQVSGF